MDGLGGPHAVGPGRDLGLQAGVRQGLHQEHPPHKAEVQPHRPRLVHQQHPHPRLVLQPHSPTETMQLLRFTCDLQICLMLQSNF